MNATASAETVIADLRDDCERWAAKHSEDLQRMVQLEDRLLALTKDMQRLVHERDRLHERNERLEATHKLWSNVDAALPMLGLCCDGDGCKAAIGVVGVTVGDVDKMLIPALGLANAAGWSIDGRPGDHEHYCPSCSKKRKP